MQKRFLFFICCCLSLSFAFIKEHGLFLKPTHFPEPRYDFSKNPLDSATIELGRILFYDPILSANNSISCASCHSPFNAFAHTDHNLSHGIYDSIGNRNAPALFNLAWQKSFMWDGAINHLDMQALAPLAHPKEMGSSISALIEKLKASSDYKRLFFNAYHDSAINSTGILKAFAQFQLTLVSANAKYDSVILGKEKFSDQERNGYALYKKNCSNCHTEPLFSNFEYEQNGLPTDAYFNDQGRFGISQNEMDKMKFKVPSLRNLAYTYPYMHDGRFSTLKEVIQHYTTLPQGATQQSAKIKLPMQLTSNEKVDLLAFLTTLNDRAFVFNKNHQYKKLPAFKK